MLPKIVRFTLEHDRFAVVSHARPDGDSICSSLALALALEKLGKRAVVVQADPIPSAYRRLPEVQRIRISKRLDGDYQGLFVLESSSFERTGVQGLGSCFTVNIDHHSHAGDFGDINWNDPSRSAVGEMILELILALGAPVDAAIASNLYVALLTDTGSFQFTNTRRETFRVAAKLVELGASPGELARLVYLSQPLAKVRLLERILKSLELHPSGKIAWVALTLEDFSETGGSLGDTEGLVTHPLSIDGVFLVAFFRQETKSEYRVSLRSKGSHDVAEVARRFGGGGHPNAAGFSLSGTQSQVQRRVVAELERLLTD